MNTKVLKKLFIVVFFILFITFMIPKVTFAGTQELNNLNFNIELTTSGDMIVKELWDVDFEDTQTLFKTFPLDGTYDEINNVSVTETTDGNIVPFTQKYDYQYHVDPNCFQALVNEDNEFEIAWGVEDSEYNSNRQYEITYTVKNNITLYNDCAELYWKFIGNNFGIHIQNINGTITLPKGIDNIEELRVWAHGPLNGTIHRDSQEQVSFEVKNLYPNTFLEIRLAMPKYIFGGATRIVNSDKLESIIKEETKYADEANHRREIEAKKQRILEIFCTIVCVLGSIWCIKYFFDLAKNIRENPEITPEQEIKYFRDMPDENASAAEASYLYYFSKGGITANIGKVISATMLNLCLKGWLVFEENPKNKKEVIIKLNETGKELRKDEKTIYDFLEKISDDKVFTIKDFEKYNRKHTSAVRKLELELSENVENECTENKVFDPSMQNKSNKYVLPIFILILLISFGFFATTVTKVISKIFLILAVVELVLILWFLRRFNGLTQKGANEREKWKGLKNYMEDFSMLDEREIPELVLWEKFLVYATAFGIADKVIKQLKVKFPELNNEEYLRTNYAYMYMAFNTNNDFNFIDSMSSSIGSSMNYSSGSGAGGGFSGGGGGGRRRRWWRRSLSLDK